ncbi:MAG: Uma2 family endonuclease [Hyphomicrobiales bacterium]|nr:Uma2 family endonuclease [Hyphomicrobiales bacterium]
MAAPVSNVIFVGMEALKLKPMTVDEFLVWAEGREGRYELHDGEVFAMSPQRASHLEAKLAISIALRDAIKSAKLNCFSVPDGATVRINDITVFEPDALVYCGEKAKPHQIEFPNPIIVVEVLSPNTGYKDLGEKLRAYFTLPSVNHYLVADPDKKLLIHHARGGGDELITRIVTEGALRFDPPGLTITAEDIFS